MKNTHQASSIKPYQYWVRVVKVIDGDTVDGEIQLGFELTMKARLRLEGIGTPEIFGVKHASAEYKRGIAAKLFLESLIPESGWVEGRIAQSSKREKYGRWLVTLFADGDDLNAKMVESGHAEVYLP